LRLSKRLDQVHIVPQAKTTLNNFSRDICKTTFTKEPKIRTIRKYNDDQLEAGRLRLIETINRRINLAIEQKNLLKLKALEDYVHNLRPSFAALKQYYRKRGDSEEIVTKLITKQNYEYLPKVYLTKEQQTDLLKRIIQYRNSK